MRHKAVGDCWGSYLGENEAKNEIILTHWSVAQAGSNDEKTGVRKSRWTVPLIHLLST